jgi:mannose-6-phosphate isomerase-like protein (cupin superfamily)
MSNEGSVVAESRAEASVHLLPHLMERQRASGEPWHEFLRVRSMSVGIYRLKAGATDPQQPHNEDEVYSIVEGRAVLRVTERDYPAEPGAVLFVPARAEHGFHSIVEDLTALVLFAPAET